MGSNKIPDGMDFPSHFYIDCRPKVLPTPKIKNHKLAIFKNPL